MNCEKINCYDDLCEYPRAMTGTYLRRVFSALYIAFTGNCCIADVVRMESKTFSTNMAHAFFKSYSNTYTDEEQVFLLNTTLATSREACASVCCGIENCNAFLLHDGTCKLFDGKLT